MSGPRTDSELHLPSSSALLFFGISFLAAGVVLLVVLFGMLFGGFALQ